MRRLTLKDVTELNRRKRNGTLDAIGIIVRHRGKDQGVNAISFEDRRKGLLCLFGDVDGPPVSNMGVRHMIVSRQRCYVRKGTFNR
jgi:hypothetical protein